MTSRSAVGDDSSPMLDVYIPRDRRAALVEGRSLHDRTSGAVLFADMSGFTKKTEDLAAELGPQRGAEALRSQVDAALGGVIDEAHRYGGSVIGFAGDAITCWFDGDDGRRATAAGLAAQRHQVESGVPAVKFAVTAGLARRFLVGHPRVQRIDVLAGGILDRMAVAEKLAHPGEVLVGSEVVGRIRKPGSSLTGTRNRAMYQMGCRGIGRGHGETIELRSRLGAGTSPEYPTWPWGPRNTSPREEGAGFPAPSSRRRP